MLAQSGFSGMKQDEIQVNDEEIWNPVKVLEYGFIAC